jgi:hypothetical protein
MERAFLTQGRRERQEKKELRRKQMNQGQEVFPSRSLRLE